ncbi:MAG TPA: CYCXC family (seleno)protein [Pyrinomonadaceae bacterium]|nr:CYCXC family (seleno)protein [Pyrinomonadaceae bacterium]
MKRRLRQTVRRRLILTCALALVAVASAGCAGDGGSERASSSRPSSDAARQPESSLHTPRAAATPAQPPNGRDPHGHGANDHGHEHSTDRVPAFQIDPASLKSLAPTLSPERFTGRQRLAYQAVKEIPETIAQLPCYCYCDKGFGHKSLHGCFIDDHAAHCAVCVDEALVAYQMQKQQNLTPAQIRERIIAHYGKQQ